MSGWTFRSPKAARPLPAMPGCFAPAYAVQPIVATSLKRVPRRRARSAAAAGLRSFIIRALHGASEGSCDASRLMQINASNSPRMYRRATNQAGRVFSVGRQGKRSRRRSISWPSIGGGNDAARHVFTSHATSWASVGGLPAGLTQAADDSQPIGGADTRAPPTASQCRSTSQSNLLGITSPMTRVRPRTPRGASTLSWRRA